MRPLAFKLILVSSVLLILFAVSETAYRVYLFSNIDKLSPFHYEAEKKPDVIFWAPPGRWKFNAEYGYDYLSGNHLQGAITKGRFEYCRYHESFNSRGNISSQETSISESDPLIILIGSSFTMTKDENGRYFHETLAQFITEKTGYDVAIENMSRASYGFIQMVDMAPVVAKKLKPDLIVIAFNTATLGMARHWRKTIKAGNGFSSLYYINASDTEKLTPDNSFAHQWVVSDLVTPDWYEKMTTALADNNSALLDGDITTKKIISRYNELTMTKNTPRLQIDFFDVGVSFLFNRIFHGNTLWGLDAYSTESPLRPLGIDDFGQDKKFIQSIERLNAMDVPYLLVHMPAYPELKTGDMWASVGYGGLPAERELTLGNSIGKTTGHKIISLLPLVGAPRDDAAALVFKATEPGRDWHPNPLGVKVIAKALATVLVDRLAEIKKKK